MKKKFPLKKVFNIVFVLAVFGLTIWSVFNGVDPRDLYEGIRQAELSWLLPGVLCVLLYVLGESVIIHYMMSKLNTRVPFRHCCLISFVGFFYSSITPGAGGGQPMQLLTMRKIKIPVAVSSIVLCIITLTFKLVLTLFGVGVMVIRPAVLMPYLEDPWVSLFLYAGIILNIIWIIGLVFLIFRPGIVRKLAGWVMKLLQKLRLLRNPERINARVEGILCQYEGTSDFFRSHLMVIVKVMLISAVQRALLFFVTYLVYRSFGKSEYGPGLITSLQTMISAGADMMPVPGGMGVTEMMFQKIFGPIFGESLVLPGMILSRGISYYTQLIICGIMTVVTSFVFKDKKKKGRE